MRLIFAALLAAVSSPVFSQEITVPPVGAAVDAPPCDTLKDCQLRLTEAVAQVHQDFTKDRMLMGWHSVAEAQIEIAPDGALEATVRAVLSDLKSVPIAPSMASHLRRYVAIDEQFQKLWSAQNHYPYHSRAERDALLQKGLSQELREAGPSAEARRNAFSINTAADAFFFSLGMAVVP